MSLVPKIASWEEMFVYRYNAHVHYYDGNSTSCGRRSGPPRNGITLSQVKGAERDPAALEQLMFVLRSHSHVRPKGMSLFRPEYGANLYTPAGGISAREMLNNWLMHHVHLVGTDPTEEVSIF